ncbi:MAG: lysylphosphatidylglycerol synthase transmembrane domain-containing protein [Rhodobacterales bacterium]|nr:lysylphosphatidylglycerol synthase transmembrane domain-containing protein [Rhodobacterales bacterium]
MKRAVQFVLGLAFAGLFVWLILRDLDREALARALRNPDWRWLALGLVFWTCGYSVRVLRWRAMLAVANPALGFWRCAVPFLASIAANNVLPFRLGDVLRCLAFSRWLAVDAGTVTATVLAERLLDLLTVLIALGLAVLMVAPREGAPGLLGVGATVLVALALLALGLLLVPGALRPLARVAEAGVRRASPAAADRLAGFSGPLIDTLVLLSRGRKMAGLIAASALVWTCEGAVYWSVAMAIPAMTAPVAAWLALPVGTLATLLPSTPGYIGTFDYFAIRAAEAGGNSTTAATAFAVLVHAYFYIPATILGRISLLVWRLQRGRE